VILEFALEPVAQLCNSESEMSAWAGTGAPVLKRLFAELAAADTLGVFSRLPFVRVVVGSAGRASAHNERASVLLDPQVSDFRTTKIMDAERAFVLAVAVDGTAFNPEGARWPKQSALSPITP
jgi:hypothetical protein